MPNSGIDPLPALGLLMPWRNEHVADTPYGANGIGVSRIKFYLSAQACNPQIDRTIERLHLTMRSCFEQPVALEWLIWVFSKKLEEIELARGKRFFLAIRRIN